MVVEIPSQQNFYYGLGGARLLAGSSIKTGWNPRAAAGRNAGRALPPGAVNYVMGSFSHPGGISSRQIQSVRGSAPGTFYILSLPLQLLVLEMRSVPTTTVNVSVFPHWAAPIWTERAPPAHHGIRSTEFFNSLKRCRLSPKCSLLSAAHRSIFS